MGSPTGWATEQRRGSLHHFLPRFTDPKLERRYRDDRLQYRLHAVRVSLSIGIAIWLSFALLDVLTIRDPSVTLFYLRIVSPLLFVPIVGLTFIFKPGRWVEWLGFLSIAVQFLLMTTAIALLSPASLRYYQPTEIWMVMGVISFVLCGVSFIEGLLLAFGVICAFFISVTVLSPEPFLRFHSRRGAHQQAG